MRNSTKSKHALDGAIIKIRRGLAIYKTHASPYYYARVRTPAGNHIVRSTKETSRIHAREAAEELAISLLSRAPITPKILSFSHFADQFIEDAKIAVNRETRNPEYAKDAEKAINNANWGLLTFFMSRNVKEITTADYADYLRKILAAKPNLSHSIIGLVTSTFRNIMKIVVANGLIPAVPLTPKPRRQKTGTRTFFRFVPLVSKENDQYRQLLATLRELEKVKVKVRGVQITWEIYDLVVFLVNSFLRPTYSELYALTHSDVTISTDPKSLKLTIRRGKTGYRVASTMEVCVSIYERLLQRVRDENEGREPLPNDYLFFPSYKNRKHALRIAQNQLNHALRVMGLELDPFTNQKHTMYSLRHTAICMRLVKSKGNVNIYTLAKNAGTSVEIIETHYAKMLPITNELLRNLQSFGN